MITMGGERENQLDGMLADVEEILSEAATPAEAKDILRESAFFGSSPNGLSFLLRWMLDDKNTDAGLYATASETLERILREGKTLGAADNAALDKAEKGGSEAAGLKALKIREILESIREEELDRMRQFLFGETPEGMKKAMVGDAAYFLGEPKRMDLLVEFMLDYDRCGPELFEAALKTYQDLNEQGAAGSDAQISMVGRRLAEGEQEMRAHELFELMAKSMLRQVLENPHVPESEKLKLLQNVGIFMKDPRAFGVLIWLMLDNEAMLSNKELMGEARMSFSTLLGMGLKPKEDHLARMVGTLTAGPGRRALPEAQRDNAFWMLKQLMVLEILIPREWQGKIMNAATQMLPEKDNPAYGQQKERKIYGLRGVRLILADWMGRLKLKVEETPKEWYFRPGDVSTLRADAKHEDGEVKMEAMMVNETLAELRMFGIKGLKSDSGRNLGDVLDRYAKGAPEGGGGKMAPWKPGVVVRDITPISPGEKQGAEDAARLIEKIKARRGVDILPGEQRAKKEAERVKRAKEGGGGNGG